MITLTQAVKDTTARFSHAIAGVLYYNLYTNEGIYQFSIDMNDKEDVGTTTFNAEYNGITLMRYIRKSMHDNSFVKVG